MDPNLTRAVIYVESAGDKKAVSSQGAMGLMQLMPDTATDMGVENAFDPAQNIFGGTRYLSRMIDQFGSLDLALWAYNAGPEAVKRKRLPSQTRHYIPNVIRVKRLLDNSQK
jgi:soluble lytic murein transglycosylase-like protein